MAYYVTDIGLDNDPTSPYFGDLAMDAQGNGALIEDAEAVRQRLLIRFQTFYGEFFADQTIGMKWYEYVFTGKKPVDMVAVNCTFLELILTTPGIDHLAEPINYNFDNSQRLLSASFTAVLASGQTLNITVPGVAP